VRERGWGEGCPPWASSDLTYLLSGVGYLRDKDVVPITWSSLGTAINLGRSDADMGHSSKIASKHSQRAAEPVKLSRRVANKSICNASKGASGMSRDAISVAAREKYAAASESATASSGVGGENAGTNGRADDMGFKPPRFRAANLIATISEIDHMF
jgi:hypothetical protein